MGLGSCSLAYLLNGVQDDCPTSQNKRENQSKIVQNRALCGSEGPDRGIAGQIKSGMGLMGG